MPTNLLMLQFVKNTCFKLSKNQGSNHSEESILQTALCCPCPLALLHSLIFLIVLSTLLHCRQFHGKKRKCWLEHFPKIKHLPGLYFAIKSRSTWFIIQVSLVKSSSFVFLVFSFDLICLEVSWGHSCVAESV